MAVVVSVLSGAESAYWGSFTASVIKPACGASSRTTEKFPAIIVTRALIRPIDPATFKASTRVLVRPTGLDMVEVGGTNPPGPTKFLSPCFYSTLFFQNHAFWRVSARGHYRGKGIISDSLSFPRLVCGVFVCYRWLRG